MQRHETRALLNRSSKRQQARARSAAERQESACRRSVEITVDFHHVHERWTVFSGTPGGKRLIQALRLAFVAAILGVLIYQLSEIGWSRILTSLPTQPAFYALVVAMYFLLPATESLIYGRLWSLAPLKCLGIMIRKRVLNVDVVGYSGEVYLFLWAKHRVEQAPRALMGAIKDNLIISSASSLAATSLLIAGLLLAGQLPLDELVTAPSPYYISLAALAAVFVGAVAYRFRGVLFSLPRRVLALLAGAHVGRFVLGYMFQIVAWWIVVPAASFQTWAILLVVFVLINRIPFLPSSDLFFVSAGAGITPLLDVPVAPVVSMLLIRSATDRLLNLLFFTSSVWLERQSVSTGEDVLETGGAIPELQEDEGAEKRPTALNT
jgi:hypothetical protein